VNTIRPNELALEKIYNLLHENLGIEISFGTIMIIIVEWERLKKESDLR